MQFLWALGSNLSTIQNTLSSSLLLPFCYLLAFSLFLLPPKKYHSRDSLIHSSLHSIFRRLPNQTLITGFRPNLDLFPISLFLPRYTQFHWLLPRLRRVTPSLSSLPLASLHSLLAMISSLALHLSLQTFSRALCIERYRRGVVLVLADINLWRWFPSS